MRFTLLCGSMYGVRESSANYSKVQQPVCQCVMQQIVSGFVAWRLRCCLILFTIRTGTLRNVGCDAQPGVNSFGAKSAIHFSQRSSSCSFPHLPQHVVAWVTIHCQYTCLVIPFVSSGKKTHACNPVGPQVPCSQPACSASPLEHTVAILTSCVRHMCMYNSQLTSAI